MFNSFNEEVVKRYLKEDRQANCRVITFQITEDCCLNCSYCYQINKSHKMMTKEVAKAGIDLLFKMYDENKEDAFINHHTKGLVIEFIGGEPFMNIEIMDYITSYFIDTCIQKDHLWLTNTKFSISSNGMLYFQPAVQNYLKKYQSLVTLNITIDGPKELHDICRRTYENEGSFDQAYKAWLDYKQYVNEISTKITIAPENLLQIDTIFNFFLNAGCRIIHGNPIFEHKWTIEEAKIYYKKLLILADTLLSSKIIIENNLFSENIGSPQLSTENNNWCGGTGDMLSFDPDGIAFPCIRYMKSSLGNSRKPIIIGDVNGLYTTEKDKIFLKQLSSITRRSQSTDECFNCHISSGCAWCSAWNYQETGDINKRSTNICWMHRARVLANVYYWNNYYKQNNINKKFVLNLDRTIATNIIDNNEYDKLLQLSTQE